MAPRLTVVALLLCLGGCKVERTPPPPGVLTLTGQEQVATWVRNFNPLMPGSRWPSMAGIYEPMGIFNTATGKWVPWLATGWKWSDDSLSLTFSLRPGVQWNDGQPFTAADVVFTFELIHSFPALDQKAVWAFVTRVEQVDQQTVRFHFSKPFVPGLQPIAQQPIVPQHTWKDVANPVTFTNPTPVATGPFTEVRLFQPQVYELGRNPHYWQPGKPKVEAIRLPAFPGNDQANLALVDGELDWAANYVPAIERVYLKKDPEHHHAWFPPYGSMVLLYANTTKAPFDDVRVRKALSMGIDRQLVVDVAMSRYTTPADATALSASFESWRDPELVKQSAALVTFDSDAANKALDDAGLKRDASGARHLTDGKPFAVTLQVVNGWSDWVRAAQVISRGYKKLGIDVQVKLLDQGAWFQRLQGGDFELAIAWSNEGATPWEFYRWLMSPATVLPVGKPSVGNWHRYASERAGKTLEAFERAVDEAQQHELGRELQREFVEELPAIPLFANPAWAEFNTTRFTGFPDAEHPWAVLSPNRMPDALLVMPEITPVSTEAR